MSSMTLSQNKNLEKLACMYVHLFQYCEFSTHSASIDIPNRYQVHKNLGWNYVLSERSSSAWIQHTDILPYSDWINNCLQILRLSIPSPTVKNLALLYQNASFQTKQLILPILLLVWHQGMQKHRQLFLSGNILLVFCPMFTFVSRLIWTHEGVN